MVHDLHINFKFLTVILISLSIHLMFSFNNASSYIIFMHSIEKFNFKIKKIKKPKKANNEFQ